MADKDQALKLIKSVALKEIHDLNLGEMVFKKRALVHVPVDTPSSEILQILKDQNILAVPLYDVHKRQYIGFVSAFEIMAFVAFALNVNDPDQHHFASIKVEDLPGKDILGVSRESEYLWTFKANDKLSDILECMSKGVHRILIDDHNPHSSIETEHQFSVLTQSDVVKFFAIHSEALGPICDKTLTELGLLNKYDGSPTSVSVLTEKDTAITAFKKMYTRDVQAMPIVDSDDKIIGTLSPSDVRGLTVRTLKDLLLPVCEFLKVKYNISAPRKPITLKANATLYKVINICAISRIHRVWITDDYDRPVGCVSLSDIISIFSPFDWHTPPYI